MAKNRFIKGLIVGSIIAGIANYITLKDIGVNNIIISGILTGLVYHFLHQEGI